MAKKAKTVSKKSKVKEGGNYFASKKKKIRFIPSGSKTHDLALGGGWAIGRVSNIVGDKSSGKTLLCIEACANFAAKYPEGRIIYRETESAFDKDYARALGMPVSRVEFGDEMYETVEDIYDDIKSIIKEEPEHPVLYILDSLDAISDKAEMAKDFDAGSFGGSKPKQIGALFRRLNQDMTDNDITLMIVSQERDKIGVMFGEKTTRSGGRALDFYASQILWLHQLQKIEKTISGIKRKIGINIKAQVKKNKVGLPFREATFPILFGYGIDDMQSCLDWLKSAKSLKLAGLSESTDLAKLARSLRESEEASDAKQAAKIKQAVEDRWYEIEESFLPKKQKYGG